MAEATANPNKPKVAKPAIAGLVPVIELPKFEMPKFEMPKFDMPKFEMPKMEMPAAFRDMAEKSIAQAKDSYERVKAAAEDATDMLEDTCTMATKGATDYNLKLIEAARANANAVFDFASALFGVKSLSELVELSTTHARKQFDTVSAQTKELTTLAQKVATDTSGPIKDSMSRVFNKAA